MGGQPPVNDRRVGGKHNTVKQADSGLGGVDAQEFPGGIPEADHVLAFCQASFHMTLSRVGFLRLAPGRRVRSSLGPHPSLASGGLRAPWEGPRDPETEGRGAAPQPLQCAQTGLYYLQPDREKPAPNPALGPGPTDPRAL